MLQTGIVKGICQVQAPGTLGTSDRRGTKAQHHSFVIPTLLQIIIPGQTRQGHDYFGLLLSCPAPWGTSPLKEVLMLVPAVCPCAPMDVVFLTPSSDSNTSGYWRWSFSVLHDLTFLQADQIPSLYILPSTCFFQMCKKGRAPWEKISWDFCYFPSTRTLMQNKR